MSWLALVLVLVLVASAVASRLLSIVVLASATANSAATAIYCAVMLPKYFAIAVRGDFSVVTVPAFRRIIVARFIIFGLLGFNIYSAIGGAG